MKSEEKSGVICQSPRPSSNSVDPHAAHPTVVSILAGPGHVSVHHVSRHFTSRPICAVVCATIFKASGLPPYRSISRSRSGGVPATSFSTSNCTLALASSPSRRKKRTGVRLPSRGTRSIGFSREVSSKPFLLGARKRRSVRSGVLPIRSCCWMKPGSMTWSVLLRPYSFSHRPSRQLPQLIWSPQPSRALIGWERWT